MHRTFRSHRCLTLALVPCQSIWRWVWSQGFWASPTTACCWGRSRPRSNYVAGRWDCVPPWSVPWWVSWHGSPLAWSAVATQSPSARSLARRVLLYWRSFSYSGSDLGPCHMRHERRADCLRPCLSWGRRVVCSSASSATSGSLPHHSLEWGVDNLNTKIWCRLAADQTVAEATEGLGMCAERGSQIRV